MTQIAKILLTLPLNDAFDYEAPEDVHIGDIVRVPFGKKTELGLVWATGQKTTLAPQKLKSVIQVFPHPLKPTLIEFIKWVASYNLAPLGLVLKMVLCAKDIFNTSDVPPRFRLTGKTLAEAKLKNSDARWHVIDLLKHAPYTKAEIMAGTGVSQSVIKTLTEAGIIEPFAAPKALKSTQTFDFEKGKIILNDEQQAAADFLSSKQTKGFQVTLLDGVTGSGKTEVYLEAAISALKQNKQVLILVPEIALSTQWLKRFENRFGVKPYEWHSALTLSERRKTWQAVIENRAKILVGARSALFLPFADLSLIIVDESHDQTFKQEDMVNYQARDMAVVRAKCENIPLILSTATPDLETIVNVETGKYDTVCLKSRYACALMPDIKIIDLKKDKPQKGDWGTSWISPPLVDAIKQNLDKGEQSMLFLNRRGYAPLIICRDCGHRLQCPNCSAWLTEHRSIGKLICHHCGYNVVIPSACPECGSQDGLTACGPGVERIAHEVKARFPSAKTEIISSDTATSLSAISDVIARMQNRQIDILIGTQILAKGHHFPLLTLVGIVDADLGLMGSDLRAQEQTFQLLSQVSGRAGRGDKKGDVYLQTLYPDNKVLNAIVHQDRSAFLEQEKATRQMLCLPPFGKLAAVIVSSSSEDAAQKAAYLLAKRAPHMTGVTLLGPAPAPIYMLRSKFRYRLLLKTLKTINIQSVIKTWLHGLDFASNVKVEVDIDPYSFM